MLLYRFDGNSSRLKALNHSVHKPPTWDPLNRLEVGRVHFRLIQWAPDSVFLDTSVQGPFVTKLILLHSAGPPESVAPSFVQKFHCQRNNYFRQWNKLQVGSPYLSSEKG